MRTSPIISRVRQGYGQPSLVHSVCLNRRDLPLEFFLIAEHRRRVAATVNDIDRDDHWRVEAVEVTDRVEEVYCATVEGIGAFGLADGLMTGNCPFSNGRQHFLERYQERPEAAMLGLVMEYGSLALNPRMSLYASGKTLRQTLTLAGNLAALRLFAERLDAETWGLYHVRRIYKEGNITWRSVVLKHTGSRQAMEQELAALSHTKGLPIEDDKTNDIRRLWLRRKEDDHAFPKREELYVVLPALVQDKARPGFERLWDAAQYTRPMLLAA